MSFNEPLKPFWVLSSLGSFMACREDAWSIIRIISCGTGFSHHKVVTAHWILGTWFPGTSIRIQTVYCLHPEQVLFHISALWKLEKLDSILTIFSLVSVAIDDHTITPMISFCHLGGWSGHLSMFLDSPDIMWIVVACVPLKCIDKTTCFPNSVARSKK